MPFLAPNQDHPSLWHWWFLILSLHGLFAFLLVHNRIINTIVDVDFDDSLRDLATELLSWLIRDRWGAFFMFVGSLVVWLILTGLAWRCLPRSAKAFAVPLNKRREKMKRRDGPGNFALSPQRWKRFPASLVKIVRRAACRPLGPMDLAISRPDRIRRILRNSAAGDALRVHLRSQIARVRADYELFSKMS